MTNDAVIRIRRIVLPLLFIAAVLAYMEASVRIWHVSPLVLAAPSKVFATLMASLPLFLEHAKQTAVEASIGFVLGALSGVVIAMLMSMWQPLQRALYPNLIAFQLLPKIALAPLFTLWLGVGAPSRIVFTIFLCFFPAMVATMAGMTSAPAYATTLARSLKASRLQTFTLVHVPFAVPFIMSGLKVAATLAMIGIVVGEFVTAQSGLGYLIMFASSSGDSSILFAALFLLCIEGLVLYGAVVIAERLVQRWYGAPFEATATL